MRALFFALCLTMMMHHAWCSKAIFSSYIGNFQYSIMSYDLQSSALKNETTLNATSVGFTTTLIVNKNAQYVGFTDSPGMFKISNGKLQSYQPIQAYVRYAIVDEQSQTIVAMTTLDDVTFELVIITETGTFLPVISNITYANHYFGQATYCQKDQRLFVIFNHQISSLDMKMVFAVFDIKQKKLVFNTDLPNIYRGLVMDPNTHQFYVVTYENDEYNIKKFDDDGTLGPTVLHFSDHFVYFPTVMLGTKQSELVLTGYFPPLSEMLLVVANESGLDKTVHLHLQDARLLTIA